MKEHPILFSAPMIRAILDGRKTMTRRIVKSQHVLNGGDPGDVEVLTRLAREYGPPIKSNEYGVEFDLDGVRGVVSVPLRCPFGEVGDRLWVREAFALAPACSDPDPEFEDDWHVVYRATEADPDVKWLDADGNAASPWKPSIHMPRWASRITLEVTDVRVERLQAITEEDARAEGVDEIAAKVPTARDAFRMLWSDINWERAPWDTNPWLWVVSFRRVDVQSEAA